MKKKYHDQHPNVLNMLDNFLYVNDLISGADLDNKACYLLASEIFKDTGMNLRKFKHDISSEDI